MSAIVTVNKGKRAKLPIIRQFEKDSDVPIQLCKVRSPQSKGKCESANRFAAWLEPYQGTLNSEEELISLIHELNSQINCEPCRTTGQIRNVLMQKEKEHLRPLNRQILLDRYLREVDTQTVPATLLVTYKGRGYSVPKQYAGKRVKLVNGPDSLQIYYNSKLICTHELTEQPINYKTEHYTEALKATYKKRDDETEESYDELIRKKAEESIER